VSESKVKVFDDSHSYDSFWFNLAEKYLEASSTIVQSRRDQAPQIVAVNPLDKLDCKYFWIR
jgi:hypothetical protein